MAVGEVVPEKDPTQVLAQMLAKKAVLNLGGSALEMPQERENIDVAAAAKFMLDCGLNLYSTNACCDVEMGPIVKGEPKAVLGHQGLAVVDAEIVLPHLNFKRKATVSRRGPNMAPLGRLGSRLSVGIAGTG